MVRLGAIAFLVGMTVLFVGKKVHLTNVCRCIDSCQERLEELQEERAGLTAAIVFRQKPAAIEHVARRQLRLDHPGGHMREVSFRPHQAGVPE